MNIIEPNIKDYVTRLERILDTDIDNPETINYHIGTLTSYARECAHEMGWLDNVYLKFDDEQYAQDLIDDGQVIQVSGTIGDLFDEFAVWVTNPDDFRDNDIEIDDDDGMEDER